MKGIAVAAVCVRCGRIHKPNGVPLACRTWDPPVEVVPGTTAEKILARVVEMREALEAANRVAQEDLDHETRIYEKTRNRAAITRGSLAEARRLEADLIEWTVEDKPQ